MELKRVVVTGLGAVTPLGNSVPEFWDNLVKGVSGAAPITHFDTSFISLSFFFSSVFSFHKYISMRGIIPPISKGKYFLNS